MANIFVDLPVPLANGAGASVAIDGMGQTKTFTYQGNLFAAVQVQVSADNVQWRTIHTFNAAAAAATTQRLKTTIDIAARFARAFVNNFRSGTAANMDAGANDNGTQAGTLVPPASNGSGAALDVSALGTFRTIFVNGVYTGNVIIEISEDGNDWSPLTSFGAQGGLRSFEFSSAFVRVTRNNAMPSAPGLPVVSIVAVDDATPGGGGYVELTLQGLTNGGSPTAILTTDGAAPVPGNIFVLPDDTTWLVEVQVVAAEPGSVPRVSAGYLLRAVIERGAGAATTTIVGSVAKTVLGEDDVALDAGLAADNVNGALEVDVVGNANVVEWRATLRRTIFQDPPT